MFGNLTLELKTPCPTNMVARAVAFFAHLFWGIGKAVNWRSLLTRSRRKQAADSARGRRAACRAGPGRNFVQMLTMVVLLLLLLLLLLIMMIIIMITIIIRITIRINIRGGGRRTTTITILITIIEYTIATLPAASRA